MKTKILVTSLIILLGTARAAAQKPAPIQGDYAEMRSGEVFTCGCLYSSEMVTAGREAILVWRIRRGSYRGTPLVGIKVAAVVVGDANLGAYPGARRSVLFLDGIRSDAQQQAIRDLWAREYSDLLGEVRAVHLTRFKLDFLDDTVRVAIPGTVEVRARKALLPEDAHPGSFLWYDPFTTLRDSFLATAVHYEYSGGDFQHQWTDLMPAIRGYVGKFELN